ncbi:hypothetical protein QF036_002470 [Arthrobacter globiformis]|nr:hypothetical protein [Arthrobacter globiformis]
MGQMFARHKLTGLPDEEADGAVKLGVRIRF